MLWLCRDNGNENGNYCILIGFRVKGLGLWLCRANGKDN